MNTIKSKGMYWSVLLSVILLAMPMWVMANDASTPDIQQLKQIRQLQNQSTIVRNLDANTNQVSATPEQERLLRLTKALTRATGQQTPDLKKSYRLNLGEQDLQVPQINRIASREVIFNQGVLSAVPGMEYFNFMAGMNSPDSMGMDVRITGNEGTNFGSEGAGWIDPSLLLYFASMGTLDTVLMVPPNDDPSTTWGSVSWELNGYQPLAVGNIFVVYTRTGGMYVALEVTSVDAWGQYFEFDYIIQTNGSNEFEGGMIDPPTEFDMTVNGEYADTLEIGSNPYFEIMLDGAPYGELMVFWDGNHNGTWDDGDVAIEMYEFMDNDEHDEDPADGIFGFTYTDEMADGINYLADDLVFVAFQAMNMAEVAVTFYSLPTPFSVSGTVWEETGITRDLVPLSGIVVWASYEWDDSPSIIGVTDDMGAYHLDLPDTGFVMVGSADHLMMTDGLIAIPEMHPVLVTGHEVDYDFIYDEPSSVIQGYVYDDAGSPIVGIQIDAHAEESGFSAITDESGFYSMGVMPGYYHVQVDWWSLPQPYMLHHGAQIDIEDGEVVEQDFYLISTNSMIAGIVLMDGMPYPEAMVWGDHPDYGWSATISDENGNYLLPVFDGGNTLYHLGVHVPDMPNVVQVSDNHDVPAGTDDEIISLETLYGGIFGYFINGETNEPIMDTWEIGMMLRDVITGMEFHTGPNPEGYYEMWIPDGLYEIMAGGMNWHMEDADTLLIDGAQVEYDVILWPVGVDTFVEGYVFDQLGAPIMDAEVMIGNEGWGAMEYTDENGFYHINAPYGFYMMYVYADGFMEEWSELDLNDGFVTDFNFYLTPFMVDGAIAGMAYDAGSAAPVSGANVYIYADEMGWVNYTDEYGEFWFDMPNGEYDMVIDHYDYAIFWYDDIVVNNDTVYVDAPMSFLDAGLEGYVYDDETNEPIWDAEIVIVSTVDSTGFWGYTDEFGYYSIPALNGEYQVFASAPGYDGAQLGMVTIADAWAYLDIYLGTHQFATAPEINFIIDQPNDQGRQVRMQFWPGGLEWGSFTGYSIWRLTNTPMGEIVDFVDYIPNHDLEAYNLVAPTLVDSNAYTSPDQYLTGFMVTGHWDVHGYVDGMPGVGYSIDNIHPGVPGTLALLSTGAAGVEIGWEASMADDFQYFEVYRATNPEFTNATLTQTLDIMFADGDVSVGQTYYYMVAAVDANGNIGEGTNVISTSIVSIDDAELLPTAFGLTQNYPNPFNPTTTIEFALPQAAHVSLEIYNLLGQRVRTLVSGYMQAGYINTSWDGLNQNGQELSSGTYIYRLKTADLSFTKKMVLMK
ncbi:MAG: carboxypeptidase regulatory-like domain-containing protein [Candidatus Marinimicrobia bacterium]|nr:carboxypeptidase regulatory-like domain-containing protein [Candidatus Neomarinimicrobiota bacterium]